MKKCIAIILALLLLCGLAACGGEPPVTSGDNSDWVWVRDYTTHGAISDTGYYYVSSNALYYADFAAKASTVLCNTVGCSHGSDECDAYLPSHSVKQLLYWNERIYYFDMFEPVLYSRNAIGMELKKVGTVGSKYIEEQKAVEIGRYVVADGYLYYEADIADNITTEDGVHTTAMFAQTIGRINLTTGKDEILVEEKVEKGVQTTLILCAVRESGLLINYWTGLDVDRNDPDYSEKMAKAKSLLVHWDGETGEMTTLFEKTTRECAGIKMVSGGKVYYKTHSSVEAEDRGYLYSYDLNTGKEETVCDRNMQWLLGGGYVQCYDVQTRERSIYDMNTGKVLPYELDSSIVVFNIGDNGFVMRMSFEYYYVTLESLADGLQEADLQFLYTMNMGNS